MGSFRGPRIKSGQNNFLNMQLDQWGNPRPDEMAPLTEVSSMAIVKATMLIQLASATSTPASPTHRIGGWSESWYFLGSAADARDTMINAGGLCQRRAAMLPTGGIILGQRFQLVDPPGPSVTLARAFPASSGRTSDIPQMALYINCPGVGAGNIKRALHRGVPDVMVTEGEYDPSPTYAAAVLAYISALGLWRFRALDLTEPLIEVVSVTAGGLFTTLTDHGFLTADRVTLKGVISDATLTAIGGRYKVLSVPTPTTFTVQGWPAVGATGGGVRKVVVIYPLVDAANTSPVRATTRKVGRPFDQYRGRR
jgi:hypothetical protein